MGRGGYLIHPLVGEWVGRPPISLSLVLPSGARGARGAAGRGRPAQGVFGGEAEGGSGAPPAPPRRCACLDGGGETATRESSRRKEAERRGKEGGREMEML